MSGPSKDIPASELWLKLSSHERPFKVVDFPRKDLEGNVIGQLAVRILTQEEQMVCTSAAEAFCRKHIKDGKKDELGYERLFTDAICVEVLYRACRDADNPSRPAFPSPKHIQEGLTTEECAKLFDHYLTAQVELGPLVVTMTDEEMDAWVSRLAEGGSSFPFDLLSSDLQRLVLLHMAFLLRGSSTDSISAGELPDESSSSTETSQPEVSSE